MTRLTSALVILFVAFAQPSGQAIFGSDAVLDRIFADWNQRHERVKRVMYSVKGQQLTPAGWIEEGTPKEDMSSAITLKLLLDFETGRMRKETRRELYDFSSNHFDYDFMVRLFDGEQFQTYLSARQEP